MSGVPDEATLAHTACQGEAAQYYGGMVQRWRFLTAEQSRVEYRLWNFTTPYH